MNGMEREQIRRSAALDIEKGVPFYEVCTKYNRSPSWVREACEENNISVPKLYNNKTKLSSFQILKELFDTEKTMESIANEMEVTRQRVSQIYGLAKEADIPGLPRR